MGEVGLPRWGCWSWTHPLLLWLQRPPARRSLLRLTDPCWVEPGQAQDQLCLPCGSAPWGLGCRSGVDRPWSGRFPLPPDIFCPLGVPSSQGTWFVWKAIPGAPSWGRWRAALGPRPRRHRFAEHPPPAEARPHPPSSLRRRPPRAASLALPLEERKQLFFFFTYFESFSLL